jgi:hypothetical protein
MLIWVGRLSLNQFLRFRGSFSLWLCKGDASLPPGAYPGMAQGLGDSSVIEVDGNHEASFTRPGIAAQGFIQAVK